LGRDPKPSFALIWSELGITIRLSVIIQIKNET